MALKFADGFDHYATADLSMMGWSIVSGSPLVVAGAGRNSTPGLRLTAINTPIIKQTLTTSHASGILCLGYMYNSVYQDEFLRLYDTSTVHLTFRVNGSNVLEVRRGVNGTVLATGTQSLTTNVYYHLQIKFTIDDTVGSVEVRIDGSPTNDLTFSGDTRNGGASTWNAWSFHHINFAGFDYRYFEDVVAFDGADSGIVGLPNNDWPGDIRVGTLLPQTDAVGAGDHAAFTPSTGTDHGAMVDEASQDGDTTYLSGSTLGNKECFQYPALSFTPASVFGVITCPAVRKTDSGSRSIKANIRLGSTDYLGAEVALGTSYLYRTEVREANPATGLAWDVTAVNALQAGIEITV